MDLCFLHIPPNILNRKYHMGKKFAESLIRFAIIWLATSFLPFGEEFVMTEDEMGEFRFLWGEGGVWKKIPLNVTIIFVSYTSIWMLFIYLNFLWKKKHSRLLKFKWQWLVILWCAECSIFHCTLITTAIFSSFHLNKSIFIYHC